MRVFQPVVQRLFYFTNNSNKVILIFPLIYNVLKDSDQEGKGARSKIRA